MCEGSVDEIDAASLAGACFEQIVAVIEDSIKKAESLGAADMVERLNSAKAAAERGSKLTQKLAAMLQAERLDGDPISSD